MLTGWWSCHGAQSSKAALESQFSPASVSGFDAEVLVERGEGQGALDLSSGRMDYERLGRREWRHHSRLSVVPTEITFGANVLQSQFPFKHLLLIKRWLSFV
jgi:hypothetical protein